MKLYDVIKHRDWSHLPNGESIGKAIRSDRFRLAQVVVVDNVTQYYYAENQREEWTAEHFPSIAPPFDNFFLETKRPTHVSSSEKGVNEWSANISRWGMFCSAMRIKPSQITPECRALSYPSIKNMSKEQAQAALLTITAMAMAAAADNNGWFIQCSLFVEGQHGIGPACNVALVCDHAGRIISNQDGMFWSWCPTFDASEFTAENWNHAKTLHLNVIHPFLLSLSLMHCKNVHVVQERPTGKEAARAAKVGRPLARYHVLKIDNHAKVSREGITEQQKRALPFHLVRGHFKTYTDDKKLFGRLTGTFWWPHHTAGSKDHGLVAKDYEVST